MILTVLAVVVIFGLWRLRRRAVAGQLAGRDNEKPIYSVAPPSRRMGSLKDGRL